jgi:fatty-acyl-CoA synthase
VPNADVGDDCMAALILRPGAAFEPAGFAAFLGEQRDLGTKMAPRYVRIAPSLPSTETNKILKRVLRDERWDCGDPVWIRDGVTYRRVADADRKAIVAAFEARGRRNVLDR